MREALLKLQVAQMLTKAGLLFVRVNAGGYRGRMKGAPRGTPDFLGYFSNGRGWAIETKASHPDSCKCESCAEQRAWRARAEVRNVRYIMARSADDALRGLGMA